MLCFMVQLLLIKTLVIGTQNMEEMFYVQLLLIKTSRDQVTNMEHMFYKASAFNQDIVVDWFGIRF